MVFIDAVLVFLASLSWLDKMAPTDNAINTEVGNILEENPLKF